MIIRGVRRIAFTLRVAEVDVEFVTSEEAMGKFNSILFFSFFLPVLVWYENLKGRELASRVE